MAKGQPIEDCTHCRGTGFVAHHGITRDMIMCSLCSGKAKVVAQVAAAYRLGGFTQAMVLKKSLRLDDDSTP